MTAFGATWTRRLLGHFGLVTVLLLTVINKPVQALSLEEQDAIRGYSRHMLMRGTHHDSIVLKWNRACLEAIRVMRPGPPVVARALAILHTAVYDAWAAYDRHALGSRFGAALRRPVEEATAGNRRKAISFAAYRVLVDLFPDERARFDQLMTGLGYDAADGTVDTAQPTGIGNVVAKAILDFRHRDGSNQLNGYADTTGYEPANTPDAVLDPNRWQPLRVPDGAGGFAAQTFAQPHWEKVTPFALTSASQFHPDPPRLLPDDEAGYRLQARRVIRYSATVVRLRFAGLSARC